MPRNRLRPTTQRLLSVFVILAFCSCGHGNHTSRSTSAAGAPRVPPIEVGLQLFRQGDLKGAEPYLAEALKSAPRDRRLLETLGSIYARTDRPKQAEDSLRAALAVEPASVGARIGLASVLVDTGRYEDAKAMLADVLRGDPGNTTARLKGALLDARLGRT
ncbi:MAG TPA: tetratricopeptide repeat protein, partial [Candidatus Dormibacteraeota bacterium]|nr:tetratricopeptide repeat protein [Candidatus Dormibacteraeota bacterium]